MITSMFIDSETNQAYSWKCSKLMKKFPLIMILFSVIIVFYFTLSSPELANSKKKN